MTVYPRHSVGQHLVPFDLIFKKDVTTQHVLNIVRKKIGTWPTSQWIYVVDSNKKLIGVVDFRTLISSNPSKRLEDIMNKEVISVTDHTHQTSLAKIALKTGLGTIPVSNKDGKFLGVVDASQILKILHEEHLEDLMKFSGILSSEGFLDTLKTRLGIIVKSRLPWLIFGLFGGIVATIVVQKFEVALKKEIALAFFIPVIVYINDTVATQTETIFVRLTTLEKVSLKKYLFNEIKVATAIGLVLSSLIYLFTSVWFGSFKIAFIVSLSMFTGIITCVTIGTLVPWVLLKLGKDPAVGSGPFTTIIQDVLSLVIYFAVASAVLF